MTCAVRGRREGEVTGHVTALVVEHLLTASVALGVSHVEHLLDLVSLSDDLLGWGQSVVLMPEVALGARYGYPGGSATFVRLTFLFCAALRSDKRINR